MKRVKIFICSISAVVLILAFFYEYYLGYMPCDLCLYQRVPYFLLIATTFIRNEKIFKYLSSALLFCSIILSVYHTQVESGILPDNCAKKIKHSSSSEEIIKQITKIERPTCGSVNVKILNISMSTWNLVLSIFLMLFLFPYSHIQKIYKRR